MRNAERLPRPDLAAWSSARPRPDDPPAGLPRPADGPTRHLGAVAPRRPMAPVARLVPPGPGVVPPPAPRPLAPVSPGPVSPAVPSPAGLVQPPHLPADLAAPERRNRLAVASVVTLTVCAPASIVLGLIARRQLAARGGRGRGLALTGLIGGSVLTVVAALPIVVAALSGAVTVHADARPHLAGSTVARVITEQAGGRVQDMRCPDDQPGTIGATTTCTATVDGVPGTLRVTTTDVQGTRILFHAESA